MFARGRGLLGAPADGPEERRGLDIRQRGVQWEGGAVDWGSII